MNVSRHRTCHKTRQKKNLSGRQLRERASNTHRRQRSARAVLCIAGISVLGLMLTASSDVSARAPERDDAQQEGHGKAVIFEVSGIQADKHYVYCGLFDAKKHWPKAEKQTKGVRARVKHGRATCVFPKVAPGAYAIAAYHDANGNGKLDTNWMGKPTEGWCTSQDIRSAWSAPKWSDAKFEVGSNGTRERSLYASLVY